MNERVAWPVFKRPLIAILRGVRPQEALSLIGVLIEEGFEAVEVPLNSPEPWTSIGEAVRRFGEDALLGAGTVLAPEECRRLADLGARLVVTPNTDPAVIGAAAARGLVTMPGVFTATEALAAWRHGASALKFFPAGSLKAEGINAVRAVLPPEAPVGAVGGVSEANFADYLKHGIEIFGMASSLYRPGDDAATLRGRARGIIRAYDEARSGLH